MNMPTPNWKNLKSAGHFLNATERACESTIPPKKVLQATRVYNVHHNIILLYLRT